MSQLNTDDNSQENSFDIDALCRLCMTRDGVTIDIFDNSENASLPLRIMACVSLEVNMNIVNQ